MSNVAELPNRQQKSDQVRQALLRYWRRSSDREIAAEINVSNRTVSNHRKRLEEAGEILPRIESTQAVEALPVRSVYFRH